ncbi:MAG: hypothetical protein KDD33_03020 [Bdellovibrionales bacterium]|nr:hypothetical protein [Bdellovibrionales bacterium]
MERLLVCLSILMVSTSAFSQNGTETCTDKKIFLRDICKEQVLQGEKAIFKGCANGFSYEVSSGKNSSKEDFVTSDIQCKILEVRMKDGIETRTSYFDEFNKKVVVYQHDNGLSNAYVYGKTGYYHITKFASGDSIYNFHSFEH